MTTNFGIIRFVAVPRGVCGHVPDQPTPLHSHALHFLASHVVGVPLAPPTRAMSLLAHKRERVCVCCVVGVPGDCRSPTRALLVSPTRVATSWAVSAESTMLQVVCVALSVPNYVMLLMLLMSFMCCACHTRWERERESSGLLSLCVLVVG